LTLRTPGSQTLSQKALASASVKERQSSGIVEEVDHSILRAAFLCLCTCTCRASKQVPPGSGSPGPSLRGCCRGRKSLCSIAADNDTALFLLHGRRVEKTIMVKNSNGVMEAKVHTVYAQPLRRCCEWMQEGHAFESVIMLVRSTDFQLTFN
jgi:hypothetical protein